MTKPLFIATADWHVKEHTWVDRPGLRGDAICALEQIVSFAVRRQLPIIAAGDLLDQKRNAAFPIHKVRTQIERLAEAGVPLYFVQGQHELQEVPWLNAIHKWPTWLTGDKVQLLGDDRYKLWGLDWTPPNQLKEKLAEMPEGVDIAVVHQVCHHWMGGITSPELDFAMVPRVGMLIAGDYHKHEKVAAFNEQGSPMLVLSPGSIAMQEINEERAKRFFVVFDDLSVKAVLLRTRPVLDCIPLVCGQDVDHFVENIEADVLAANARALAAGVPQEISDPIVYVSYDVTIPNVYERVTRAMPKNSHLFRKEILPESEDDDVTTEHRTAVLETGLIGCLPDVIDPEEEPEAYGVCHSLLSTDDPGAVLSGFRKEWIGGDDGDEEKAD